MCLINKNGVKPLFLYFVFLYLYILLFEFYRCNIRGAGVDVVRKLASAWLEATREQIQEVTETKNSKEIVRYQINGEKVLCFIDLLERMEEEV